MIATELPISTGVITALQKWLLIATLVASSVTVADGAGPWFVKNSTIPIFEQPESVEFSIQTGDFGGLTEARLRSAVERAVDSWNSVSTSRLRFRFLGRSDTSIVTYEAFRQHQKGAGKSVIIVDRTGAIIDRIFGAGTKTMAATDWALDETKNSIQKFYIVLNGRIDFQRSGSSLDETLVHELGHAVNLDHSQVNRDFANSPLNRRNIPIMFSPTASRGTLGASLLPDDVMSISSLYGTGAFEQEYGRISGRLRHSSTGADLVGVSVVAVRVRDFTAAESVESDLYRFSSYSGGSGTGNGEFVLRVPPGTYRLYIEPMAFRGAARAPKWAIYSLSRVQSQRLPGQHTVTLGKPINLGDVRVSDLPVER